MNIKLEFIPHQSVGPFELEKSIIPYLSLYPFIQRKKTDNDSWDEYSFFDESVDVYVDENNNITAIACRNNLYLNGIDLINLNIDKCFKKLSLKKENIKSEKLWISDSEQQLVYDVDELDMQLWVNNEGKIVTVFIG